MSLVSYESHDSCSSDYDSLQDTLLCYKCKKPPVKPKLLDCLHYFCDKCIATESVTASPVESLTCPVRSCRQKTKIQDNDTDNLPNVPFIEHLNQTRSVASKAKRNKVSCGVCRSNPGIAHKFCRDCSKFMCDKCVTSHESMNFFVDHQVVNTEDVSDDVLEFGPRKKGISVCPKHAQDHKLFCTGCNSPVCQTCMIEEHKGHRTKAFSELDFTTLKDSLSRLKEQMPTQLKTAQQKISSVEKDVSKHVIEAKTTVTDEFEESSKVLEKCRDTLISRIECIAEKKIKSLTQQQTEISSLHCEIDRVAALLGTCLEYGSCVEIAACHRTFIVQIQRLIDRYEDQDLEPAAISRIAVTADLSSTLKEFLDKRVNVSVPPADPATCTAEGDGLHAAEVGEQAEIVVQTFYENGQKCIDSQDTHVEVNNCTDDPKVPVRRTSASNGKYNFTYTPSKRGQLTIHVSVCGKEITGSPFQVSVKQSIMNLNGVVRKIKVSNPYQADFTPNGDLLVTESTTEGKVAIVPLSRDEAQYQDFRQPQTKCKLTHPTGLAAARDGSVYVAYSGESCVVKYDQQGDIVATSKASISKQIDRIGRIKLSNDQSRLYVCDRGSWKIFIFKTVDLEFVQDFEAECRCSDIIFDENDHILISDKNSGKILEFTKDRKQVNTHNIELSESRGIIIYDNHLCVVNRVKKRVDVFKKDDCVYSRVHSFGKCTGFADLGSITVDKSGYFYVCNERDDFVAVF